MNDSRSEYINTNDFATVVRVVNPENLSITALDVGQFRIANGLHIGTEPDSTKADLELHARLLTEEVAEFAIAVKEGNPHEILDAIGDIIYVAYGVALDCGYDADSALRIIHEANMRKLGPDGKPIIDEHGKIRKPAGWTPPDLSLLVEK